MTLKNISLSPAILSILFKHSLVEIKKVEEHSIPFLGGNKRDILFVNKNEQVKFFPDNELNFFSEVLAACHLSVEDIAIVNLDKIAKKDMQNLPRLFKAEVVILCDVDFSLLELPFQVPAFQVQSHGDKKYLQIPSLQTIQFDSNLKRNLWETLKKLFAIQ